MFNKESKMKRVYACLLLVVVFASCKKDQDEPVATGHIRPVSDTSSQFINKIYEYTPAPGQFVNAGNTGTIEGAQLLVGGINGLLSLGGYGGAVVFGFDHSILNRAGNDLGIYGNPLTVASMAWSEPGIVMVMQDLDGNGKPDDNAWYELAGSEYTKSETSKNYRITYYNPKTTAAADVTWKDNQGKTGMVLMNRYHAQSYFPLNAAAKDSISFEGTLLRNTLAPGSIITNSPFEWGYSDNGSADLIARQTAEGRGYNAFDLSWAVDRQGNKVNLSYIDFVKVYTGQNSNGNPFDTNDDPRSRYVGEISTEVSGAVDLLLKK
jgi:hypothetical protein